MSDPHSIDRAIERFEGYADDLHTVGEAIARDPSTVWGEERQALLSAVGAIEAGAAAIRGAFQPDVLQGLVIHHGRDYQEVEVGGEAKSIARVREPRRFVIGTMADNNMIDEDTPRPITSKQLEALFRLRGVNEASAPPTVGFFLKALRQGKSGEPDIPPAAEALREVAPHFYVWSEATGHKGRLNHWWFGSEEHIPQDYIESDHKKL